MGGHKLEDVEHVKKEERWMGSCMGASILEKRGVGGWYSSVRFGAKLDHNGASWFLLIKFYMEQVCMALRLCG